MKLMDLPPGDHGQRARAELDRLAVDQVPPVALAHPDQLVVGMPVRLAHFAVTEVAEMHLDHLEGVRLRAQVVDDGLRHHPH